jgi:aspartate aminotransferase
MTYADQVVLAGGSPVIIQTTVENNFVPTSEQLRQAISPKTKAIIVNSPSNPTGAILPRQTLKEIASLAMRHDFWIVSDEIYDRLVYGSKHESIYALGEEARSRTIYINGCSKTYAMTGWRIGYAIAPPEIAQAMSNLQDQVTSNPTSFAQAGAIIAMQMDDSDVEAMRGEFEARRDLILAELATIPGFQTCVPHGAFYAFPDISAHLGARFANDVELADFLLDHAHVATVPGSVFSGNGHIRLSYATSRAKIVEGISRIRNALQQ